MHRGIISGNMSGPNLFESGSGMDSRAQKPRRQLDIVGENPEMKSYRSGQQQRPQTTTQKPGVRRVNFQTIQEGPISKSRVYTRQRMNPGYSGNLGEPARMDIHQADTNEMTNIGTLLLPNQKSQPLIGKKLQTTQMNHRRKRIINFGGQTTTDIHAHSSGGNLLNSSNGRISA